MKILNLYSGLGGNRKLWGDEHEITSIEYDHNIAEYYKTLYPKDKVIVKDAHQYLLDHVLDGWDFIWASPPCPSHSKINTDGQKKPRYPSMSLYEEIIMLGNWFKGKWVVENVIPYYDPLIIPSIQIGRHFFWCNFNVKKIQTKKEKPIAYQDSNERFGFNLKKGNLGFEKRKSLRNLVDPKIGLHFLNEAMGNEKSVSEQQSFL